VPVANTTPLPVQVFVANTSAGVTSVVNLQNLSAQMMFVGLSACTPNTGLPLMPGERIRLNNVTKSVYACSNWAASSTQLATMSSSAYTAGSTQFTTSAAALSVLPAGTYFVIGGTANSSQQEVLCVASSVSTTVLTTTTASLFDHAASQPVWGVTWYPSSLNIQRGTSLPVQVSGPMSPSGQ
jgi:hypothetical protein